MKLKIEPIKKDELRDLMLIDANKLGWHYSESDVDFYFNCPGNDISAIFVDDELAGCLICHISQGKVGGKSICSAGFFLTVEKYRGKGIVGPHLWEKAFTEKTKDQLICFHSVPTAVNFYSRLGYLPTQLTNIFYSLDISQLQLNCLDSPSIQDGASIEKIQPTHLQPIYDYNAQLFPGQSGLHICNFNKAWLKREDAVILSYYENSQCKGYGVLTHCLYSKEKNLIYYRLSPLYADTTEIALLLINSLVKAAFEHKASCVEMNSLDIASEDFKRQLYKIGFFAKGSNVIVSNYANQIHQAGQNEKSVFTSIPLEYPHEITSKYALA